MLQIGCTYICFHWQCIGYNKIILAAVLMSPFQRKWIEWKNEQGMNQPACALLNWEKQCSVAKCCFDKILFSGITVKIWWSLILNLSKLPVIVHFCACVHVSLMWFWCSSVLKLALFCHITKGNLVWKKETEHQVFCFCVC